MKLNEKKPLLVFILVLGAGVAGLLALVQVIFFSWLKTSGFWVNGQDSPWPYGSLAALVLVFSLCVYLVIKKIKARKLRDDSRIS